MRINNLSPTNLKKIIGTTILVGILIFNFCIRWNNINQEPYGFESDELSWIISSLADSFHVNAAQFGIWDLHHQNLISFPVSIKFNQISFQVFGGDITSPRKFLVILSTVSLVFFFLICKQFFSYFISVLLLVLYSFSTYNLISSRVSLVSSFSNILLLPAVFLFLKSNKSKFVNSILFSFFSGLLMALSLLTYNSLYFFPIMIVFYELLIQKQPQKKSLFILIFFFLPLLFFGNKIRHGLSQQFLTRQYVMNNFPSKSDSFSTFKSKISLSANIVYSELFNNTPTDMLVSWPGPLFNKKVSILAIIGFILILFKPSAFLFLIIWSVFYVIIFHTLLGFNYPRMWISTSVLIFLLAGIPLEYVYKIACNFSLNLLKGGIIVFLCFLTLFIVKQDYRKFKNYAIFNPSFKGRERELVEIANSQIDLGNYGSYLLFETNPLRASFDKSILLFSYLSNSKQKLSDQEIKGLIDSSIFLTENPLKDNIVLPDNKRFLIINNEDDDNIIKTGVDSESIQEIISYKFHRLIFLK